jgi:nitrogen fixation protein
MTKKIRVTVGIIAAIIVLLLIIGFGYRTFFRPQYGSNPNVIGIIILSLVIGAIITYLSLQLRQARNSTVSTRTSSHTIIESIKRVFKIVVAEGQMNEIFNYENTKKLLKVIPSTKKALVIVRANVLIGYDVNKCKWEIDEAKRVIKLVNFPKPEILSLETDFNYYYFEDDLFNFISRKDLQDIQYLAKEQVKKSVLQSDLLKIASEQMKLLLGEITTLNSWQIENIALIDDFSYPKDVEEKKDEPKKTTHLLKNINLLDKAANLLKIKI